LTTPADIRREVTRKVAAALEAGTPPWRRPWGDLVNAGPPANVASKRPYSGVNPLLLSMVGVERGYRSRWWGTYGQWQALGMRVSARPPGVTPGEWGTRVVFVKPPPELAAEAAPEDSRGDERGAGDTCQFRLLKHYTVFSAEQVEGDGVERFLASPRASVGFPEYGPAERVLATSGVDIRLGGSRASYDHAADAIAMPSREAFASAHDFYAVAFHEMVHATGHVTRLNRPGLPCRFGSADYAREELVAEIGGCFVSWELGVPQGDNLTNHAAYLASWLAILGGDPAAIFTAAGRASGAADFLLGVRGPRQNA